MSDFSKEAEDLGLTDPRVISMAEYTFTSLRLTKVERFVKMWSVDEQQKIILGFLDKTEDTVLVFEQVPPLLVASVEWPRQNKLKAVFFARKTPGIKIEKDAPLKNSLYMGDLPGSVLDMFGSFVDELIFPLLINSANHYGWPHVVSQDVRAHADIIKSSVYVTCGQARGKTLLPLPPGGVMESSDEEDADDEFPRDKDAGMRRLIHEIESTVVEWSVQIREVLKRNSAQPLLDGVHPTPDYEIDFWKNRAENLRSIYNQLKNDRVKKMIILLEDKQSSYFPAFKEMFREIVAALYEAEDISLYLATLTSRYTEIENDDWRSFELYVDPLFHNICLVWGFSKYYSTPAHLVVLLQETCNFLINMAKTNLDPETILKSEDIEEALEQVKLTLTNLQAVHTSFNMHRGKLDTYFKMAEEQEEKATGTRPSLKVKEWEFSKDLAFGRFDKFIQRVETIKELFETASEFLKLEKVDFGGHKGRMLSSEMFDLFGEFHSLYQVFSRRTYDCLDVENKEFEEDYAYFKEHVSDMDKRLGCILLIGFDDCSGLEAIYKMVHIFQTMIDRPIVGEIFEPKYPVILTKLSEELDMVKIIFDKQLKLIRETGYAPVHKNFPTVAGRLKWASEIRIRITIPMDQFRSLEHPITESEEAELVYKKYEQMMKLIAEFEEKEYAEWTAGVDEACDINLNQALLTRNPNNKYMALNFNPALVAVLREVRYLNIRGTDNIPESAASLYKENETLLQFIANLDLTVNWYNKIRKTTLPVEFPLIEDELDEIDEHLAKAETELNWKSPENWEYIQSTRDMVCDLQQRIQQSKDNMEKIRQMMSHFTTLNLLDRKEGKSDSLLNLDEKEERLTKRYHYVTEAGNKIHKLVEENRKFLKVEDPRDDAWKDYLEYIDKIVMNGLIEVIKSTIKYMLSNMDSAKPGLLPFFEARMELQDPEVVFLPSLDYGLDGLVDICDGIVTDLTQQAGCISRVAEHLGEEDYLNDIEEVDELTELRNEMSDCVQMCIQKACDYRQSFENYTYLWLDNRDEFLEIFLKYALMQPPEDIDLEEMEECPPTLDQFKEQIDHFETLYEEVEAFGGIEVFDNWLRVDARPFRQSLLNIIKKWSFMFKQYLMNHVTDSLTNLSEFITEADKGLQVRVKEGDYDGLVACMGVLLAVKERADKTDDMFEPLKQTINLLKEYNQELPENVHNLLQELPERWNNTRKIAVTVKQHMAPLQATEVANIRRSCAHFDARQHEFRDKFRRIDAFRYNCLDAYSQLDEEHVKIKKMEKSMAKLLESASLFEVNVPDFKALKLCRKECILLKTLWDHIHLITTSMSIWNTTLWINISVDDMDLECKKYAKDVRVLDKEMRAWDAYLGIENAVKNMMTSLKAVSDLQSPSIRLRHWLELMHATGVKFEFNEHTTLSDVLQSNLHKYEDHVHDIVDKAAKEMGMEKVLRELDNTWTTMEFDHLVHPRTGIIQLSVPEEVIEMLEDNQVQLQNLLTSKYIAYFLDEVSSWQQKLSTSDQVIGLWFEVQRTWSHLESIFIGSEDIRNQLPEDSNRFDRIDNAFKELISEVQQTKNVVKSTNITGLYKRLEALQADLVLCEKALAQYLETKRLAFPRFYFVSSNDLLDILSNGNDPPVVAKHLTKLFDSMSDLRFKPVVEQEDEDEEDPAIVADAMHSKDGEMVPFCEDCDCSGQVEVWLNRVLDTMRATVRSVCAEAIIGYEDKPRHLWLFDYPAQVSLTVSQIWWSVEVNMAFGRLEEGYENALRDFNKKQITHLNDLINQLLGELGEADRQKIMTICTIDVHARDVVSKMIQHRVECAQAFMWQSQLRHRWDEIQKDCFVNICDAQFQYSHEYLGNTARLVITPLTDRCYITLTQSLHLVMGGAPAGPAGTGKTETTKDLGKAIGMMVYVFNCSEQMDYKSCGNIYKGLSQTGAWGCFDEFNRISVEVLSVVAVQVKTIQDAIKNKKETFSFQGEMITLVASVGVFITMNPGYAGRTELPENLKTLFRPCAMVVPDFELICEIMLVAEGFLEAKLLARKFITLYQLCKELLSKQDHYDWGLRAIKSVLVVAGTLKRDDPGRPEDQVLMRALRDFNIPKIVTDDMPVFYGLIGDLFPALDVPRKRDMDFEKRIKKATLDLYLQPEDGFVLKVVQLEELFEVRHSVFIVGTAGTGKSQVWKVLHRTNQNLKKKPVVQDLNPKAVTNDELFGIINPTTREWTDGLFSVIMRDMSNLTHDGPKWIVLDGDIDPMWIESLNTVMDDNKVLTLASNERIPLTPSMRLLFEVGHLRCATPATVSRAGILYINPADLGWNPYVTSWLDTRQVQTEKANLMILFDKYVPTCLETLRLHFKKITPVVEISHIQMLCYLLEVMLTEENSPQDSNKDIYELYFVFCCVWAFGGTMFQDQLIDYRKEFSKWFLMEFKTVKFPSIGTVFDYYIDPVSHKFEPWSKAVSAFELNPDLPLQEALVHNADTTSIHYFMRLLVNTQRPVMLVGNAGTGKTVLMQDTLHSLPQTTYSISNVPFNFYTTSEMLQLILEKPLEKKAGRNFGPPGSKRMVYFIDDMNMPEVDIYQTVQPHTLIRQHMDYHHWYDRSKLSLKEIRNTQYTACMNPTAGSFTINPRLQRHFCVFAVSSQSSEALNTIYGTILAQHLQMHKFAAAIPKMAPLINQAALALHRQVSSIFLPTAIKFHYVFNLRDLSNIYQRFLQCMPDMLKYPVDFVRLWMHEAERVYCDKLVDASDSKMFQLTMRDIVKKTFDEVGEEVFDLPNIFCHYATGMGEPHYAPVAGWPAITNVIQEGLDGYNEINVAMKLVLFEDAIKHVCRISRILEAPRGHALLVGVGGSGKQSLSRLAAYISGLEVAQITITKSYSQAELKVDLAAIYMKVGIKGIGTMFLMSDSQVADERFLVMVNDLLASGEIPDLLTDDEQENVISSVRNEVRAQGIMDSFENCWMFFIDRVRRMLKVVLCFSPVGSTLRVRARKFPAVVNCTSIDWFQEWPHEALVSVGQLFVNEIDQLPNDLRDPVAKFMAHVHMSVNEVSRQYYQNERRYNYTTPKSYLEQIALYTKLLVNKSNELVGQMNRLENGLQKLRNTSQEVDGMKDKLGAQELDLSMKNEAANKLIAVVGIETEKVAKEKAIADEEEAKVNLINIEVSKKQRDCEQDLAMAEPALLAAQEALNTLNKGNLTELRSFGQPPAAVVNVASAVLVLLAPNGKIPKDKSWKTCKVMMNKLDAFLDSLITYDKENIHENCMKAIGPFMKDPQFSPDLIRTKSFAAAGLCAWVINIVKFFQVFCMVEPKRQALSSANLELAAAQEKLRIIKNKITQLEETLAKLTSEFENATAEKMKCQEEADATAASINLANRLVGGLAAENVRWAESVAEFKLQEATLPGDILIVSAFISYSGTFTRPYRTILMEQKWLPFLLEMEKSIPITKELEPLSLLADDALKASWNNEGLPNDRMSIENATILTSAVRWPLMIDPQLQGIKWIKNKYGSDLRVVRLGSRSYLDVIEAAITGGEVVLVENMGETVDSVLDNVMCRNTVKKGRAIKMGDKDVEYNRDFRLILHTKLANPHYKPEIQAQTTLINFTVTPDGLEEQLLADVVAKERPDLETLKKDLTKQQNQFKITLKELEDSLLARLSAADGNFLGDNTLVENLENTKVTVAEIQVKVLESVSTEVKINEARESYRPAAARASLLYFILNDLNRIHPMYQFSLKAFSVVFEKAIEKAEAADEVKDRVVNLLNSITLKVFMYTRRGLFERDKLIFSTQMTLTILFAKGEIDHHELDFLLRFPVHQNVESPVDFLNNICWGGIKTLSEMEDFRGLDRDIEGSSKRWKKFVESECPEKERLPQEWKSKPLMQKLCILRSVRADRMSYAMRDFVSEMLGTIFVDGQHVAFSESFEEAGPATPVFFILSPGVDPLHDVEMLGKRLGFTAASENFHNVSLGQGQEQIANEAMATAAKAGHWVVLQNVHLVAKWLPTLEKKLEQYGEDGHEDYRVFISAEPAVNNENHIIPQGILEAAVKITNEPPTGMHANLHKALWNFDQDTLEMCTRETEFKTVLFALCYFHAIVCERRKFGPQGWNRMYPFTTGDLTISVNVLYNYLEANAKVPWEDLRYLFGEIMYGGHITDDWDRCLCRTYLQEYMVPEMLEGDHLLAPGFYTPPNLDYKSYHQYIDDELPPESPNLYGLHPNAEIEFLTQNSETLLRTIFELQPRVSGAAGAAGVSRDEMIKSKIDELSEKLPDEFNMVEIMLKVPLEARTPYTVVAFQECERMNTLVNEIKRSLHELDLGLKGELTVSTEMEELNNSLFLDSVPSKWARRAYPSLFGLAQWYADLLLRVKELETWTTDFFLPAAVWLGGFFNPQSFLTAIMQQMARKNEWPLDKMCLQCDVTKKQREDMQAPPREGSYVCGLNMDGARWDSQIGMIGEAKLKELAPPVPVMYIKAIPVDRQDSRNVYACPVYKTKQRGPTFVWTFNLKTKEKPSKWVLAGVALLLQV